MNNIEILETLANNEHIRWGNWQKYVHSMCFKNEDGSLTIPKEYVEHWNYEINTEYKELPENIKESDRKEVRKILEILNYENIIKENKELKEDNYVYHQLMQMQNKREYRSKFLKDFKAEYGENVMPDYDEIYNRYDKMKKQLENSIQKSKIKEKIDVLNTNIVNAERFDGDYIGKCRFAKYILQELLGENQ